MHRDEDRERLLSWLSVLDRANYYELLGVLQIANAEAIRQAYHDFALAFHPDGHLHRSPELIGVAQTIYVRGVEAYRTLSDATQRARYDAALAKGHLRIGDHGPATAGKGRTGAPTAPRIHSLDELCRTAAARLRARQADACLSAGDLHGARTELQLALGQDGGINPDLRERLDAIDLALFAMGSSIG